MMVHLGISLEHYKQIKDVFILIRIWCVNNEQALIGGIMNIIVQMLHLGF